MEVFVLILAVPSSVSPDISLHVSQVSFHSPLQGDYFPGMKTDSSSGDS